MLPARVRHNGGAFGDEQAFLRRRREDTAALALLHDGLVVLLRLKAEHAEAEAHLFLWLQIFCLGTKSGEATDQASD